MRLYFRNFFFQSRVLYNSAVNVKSDKMQKNKKELLNIYLKSVQAVDPKMLIRNNVHLDGNILRVCNKQYNVNKNCYLVGFGKAVFSMSQELESILDCHLVNGVVSIPLGMLKTQNAVGSVSKGNKLIYKEGAEGNLPDKAAEYSAKCIAELASKLSKDDILIVLISGGGSALLPFPKAPITLEEKCLLIKQLSIRGTTILELNCVRKRLSDLKGGGLAILAYPATVISLILSDIIGDPLDCIASGPTTPNNDDPSLPLQVIKQYQLETEISSSIRNILTSDINIYHSNAERYFDNVSNFVIGNNEIAISSAANEVSRMNYQHAVISTAVNGDVRLVSEVYLQIVLQVAKILRNKSNIENLISLIKNYETVLNCKTDLADNLHNVDFELQSVVCLLFGGEPTVNVTGTGKGGRNQQLTLQFAVDLDDNKQMLENIDVKFLSCGTDGIDGPTDAAGAISFKELCEVAKQDNLNPKDYLVKNDSYNFFNKFCGGEYLVKPGHTGTNVMDIHVLMIERKNTCI